MTCVISLHHFVKGFAIKSRPLIKIALNTQEAKYKYDVQLISLQWQSSLSSLGASEYGAYFRSILADLGNRK